VQHILVTVCAAAIMAYFSRTYVRLCHVGGAENDGHENDGQ